MLAVNQDKNNDYLLPCRRGTSRGQALILAVLVMFLLVALSGLFIAMINRALVQVARAEERQKLDGIALAGLHFARLQLQESIDGADWRPGSGPDDNNKGWFYQNGGFYKLSVRYGPKISPDDAATEGFLSTPTDRYISIDVEARYALDNPPSLAADDPQAEIYRKAFLQGKRFLVRRLTAFQPVGLTDYGLWITNKDQSPAPITIGTDISLSDMNIDEYNGGADKKFYPIYDGPLFVNGNFTAGNVMFTLTGGDFADIYKEKFKIKRADKITIAGKFASLAGTDLKILHGNRGKSLISDVDNFDQVENTTLVQMTEKNPLLRTIEGPAIDSADSKDGVNRYRALTLGSSIRGSVLSDPAEMVVQGEGLYIYNPEHYQFDNNQQTLMANWLNPTGSYWNNGVYQPQRPDTSDLSNVKAAAAIELILHDWGIADNNGVVTQLPYIELRRYYEEDDDVLPPFIRDSLQGYDYTYVEYPRNGVVFAEGNLVVKAAMPDGLLEATGGLPASLAMENNGTDLRPKMDAAGTNQLPGGWKSDTEIRYYVNRYNRRYDLTVVSAGTIYIEGNLLGPASRRANFRQGTSFQPILNGSVYDSKLALMARDNVVLNPTHMFEVFADAPEDLGVERAWRVTHDRPLTLQFSTAGNLEELDKIKLLLRHAGDGAKVFTPDQEYAIMRLMLNNVAYQWSPGNIDADKFYFFSDFFRTTYFPSIADTNQWSTAMFPGPFSIKKLEKITSPDNGFKVYGDGMRNTVQIMLDQASKAHYLLSAGTDTMGPGFVLRGLNIQVDALVYAQRGHWFVIPGKFPNNDENALPANSDALYPRYQEPYDVKIVVNGAIVENLPAPQYAEEASLLHWRGPDSRYPNSRYVDPDTGANYDSLGGFDLNKWRWVDRRAGIEYHYDATLLRPVCYRKLDNNEYDYYPRLPKLPVSPTTFTFGSMRQM